MSTNEISHRPAKSWTKLTIQVTDQQADIVAGFLATLTDIGVEYDSGFNPVEDQPVERIIAYLDEDAYRTQKIERLHDFLEGLAEQYPQDPKPKVQQELMEEKDWNKAWKAYFKPFSPFPRLIIKPTWEPITEEGKLILELDPGMAFGTGLHNSTRLCLQLIDTLYPEQGQGEETVLDVGCGTGILGMSCAMLGATKVVGIDNDIDARVAARHNITQNNLQDRMEIPDRQLNDFIETFDLVVANIIHDTLIDLSADLVKRMAAGATLILAGILAGKQAENITSVFSSLGLTLKGEEQSEEWCALCFKN